MMDCKNRRIFLFVGALSVLVLTVLYQVMSGDTRTSQKKSRLIGKPYISRHVTENSIIYEAPRRDQDQNVIYDLNRRGTIKNPLVKYDDLEDLENFQLPPSFTERQRDRDQKTTRELSRRGTVNEPLVRHDDTDDFEELIRSAHVKDSQSDRDQSKSINSQVKHNQGITAEGIDLSIYNRRPVFQFTTAKTVSNITIKREATTLLRSPKFSVRHCKVHDFNAKMDTEDPMQFECVNTKAIQNLKICLYPSINDIYVSGSIRGSGAWEYDINRAIMHELDKYPNASFIDIGANIGMHSLVAAKSGRNVLGVEPKLSTIKRLHKSVNINNLADKFILVENAISSKRSNLTLHSNNNNQGGSTLRRAFTYKETVETIVMDDLLEVFHDKEAVMKMDIEGSESRALVNSTKLFSAVKIYAIFMEWNIMKESFLNGQNTERNFAVKMVAYLRLLGYEPRHINSYFMYHNSQGMVLHDKDMARWPGDIVWIQTSQTKQAQPAGNAKTL